MRPCILAMATILVSAQAVPAQPLIGDAVPALGGQVTWLHGEASPEFDVGRVYLLDFWATWCPPCYPMIDHLSELQDRYRDDDLVVIGIAVGTDVGVPLPRFLDKEGPRISYAIAAPNDEEELKARLVHPSIMDPTDFSLPFVMLVDRQGRLAWTSDPGGGDDDLGGVVEAVMEGTFDLAAHAESARRQRALLTETAAELDRAEQLREQGRLAEAARVLLPAAERLPRKHASVAVSLFQDILCAGEAELAASFGRELLERVLADEVNALVQAERAILATPNAEERDLALAESMVRQALELKGGDHPDFLFELAKVLAAQDRMDEAESFRRRASSAADEQGWQDSYIHYISTVDLEAALEQQAFSLGGMCRSGEHG